MVGITRFYIKGHYDSAGGKRISDAKCYWQIANELYRTIFSELQMPLTPGDEVIECTKEEFMAGYDYQLGIDVILRPQNQGESTLQEKFLLTNFNTVTVEHCQDWLSLEPGDWYKLKAQYYFVGYDALKHLSLDPWVLLDWVRLQRATAQGRIHWKLRSNDREKVGAKASFMSFPFDRLPPDILVASSKLGIVGKNYENMFSKQIL